MALVNVLKPTTTFANTDKISGAELWSTITTTWASESRVWLDCVSLFDNISLSLTDPLWSYRSFPWLLDLPWQYTNTGMSNISKPS